MKTKIITNNLKKHLLFKEGDLKLYGVFSAVVYGQISSSFEHFWDLPYSSFFDDDKAEDFESVAPYLVELSPENKHLNDILELYGQDGCIFINTSLDFDELLQRMRELFNIEVGGNEGWFLFYNPVVFRNITQESDPDMMQELFEGITQYYCEEKDAPNILKRYRYDGNKVNIKTYSLEDETEA